MTTQKLSPGPHYLKRIFGDEFEDCSYCWMMDDGELWLSLIIVKDAHRGKGALHRLLDAAKELSDVVVIPNPSIVVVHTALKHGYLPSQRWIEEFGENIDILLWHRTHSSEKERTENIN